jgi:hypothetical protein
MDRLTVIACAAYGATHNSELLLDLPMRFERLWVTIVAQTIPHGEYGRWRDFVLAVCTIKPKRGWGDGGMSQENQDHQD